MPAGDRARARFRAVGVGYLRFAMDEPGLFRTAFAVPVDLSRAASPEAAGAGGRTPFQLLADSLDAMVDVGVHVRRTSGRAPSCSRGRPCTAWRCSRSRGRCATCPPGAVDELAPRLVRMVDLGLGVCPTGPAGGAARYGAAPA